MKCKECNKAEASTTLNDVDLCEECANKLEPKLRDIGRLFDEMREERRANIKLYGNSNGSIDRNEYWGRRGRGL